jgi:hypothetical protein
MSDLLMPIVSFYVILSYSAIIEIRSLPAKSTKNILLDDVDVS